MRTLLSFLVVFCSYLPAQDIVAAIPQGSNSAWTIRSDGSAALLELSDGKLIIRQLITSTPQVLRAEWKDRTGVTHKVETDCRNITIQECFRRHNEMIAAYQAAFPPA